LVSNPGGVGLLGSVERCLELCCWHVAAVAMQAVLVEPVHPAERGELELVDVGPGSRRVGSEDALGLVEAVGGLGQGVVERIGDGADRGSGADLVEAFGESHAGGPVEFAQYTSWAFTRRAIDSGLVPSMGSIGDCYDNGMMESFWARMQVELLNRRRWRTRLELANAIFEYLEIFHNRQRRHSALGMLTPIEYEIRHQPPARDQAS
jgi:putative transposase